MCRREGDADTAGISGDRMKRAGYEVAGAKLAALLAGHKRAMAFNEFWHATCPRHDPYITRGPAESTIITSIPPPHSRLPPQRAASAVIPSWTIRLACSANSVGS